MSIRDIFGMSKKTKSSILLTTLLWSLHLKQGHEVKVSYNFGYKHLIIYCYADFDFDFWESGLYPEFSPVWHWWFAKVSLFISLFLDSLRLFWEFSIHLRSQNYEFDCHFVILLDLTVPNLKIVGCYIEDVGYSLERC